MTDKIWSFSRFQIFKTCPKAFWFNMHSNGRSRNLISLNSIVGTIVHKSIAHLITMWAKGNYVSDKEVKQCGLTLMKRLWENRNHIIIEYINEMPPDENINTKIQNSINIQLERFFLYIWPTFSNDSYVTHEKLFELNISGYKVLVRPDLVTKDLTGNIVITDWKTGISHDDFLESSQVYGYGLWATNYYGIDPERIILKVINLRTGRKIGGKFSLEKREETLERIKSQIKELDSISQGEIPEAKPEFNKCKECSHLKFCVDGKRILNKI
jgi:CRISPR/Cas system-associated exonuclease Cas4 (RecB family)